MTSPVFRYVNDRQEKVMAFVMPETMSLDKVPQPSNDSVRVKQVEGGTFAVYTFNGMRTDQLELDSLNQFKKWLGQKEEYDKDQMPMFGYFDPPGVAAEMRRNEVMLRLTKAGQQ